MLDTHIVLALLNDCFGGAFPGFYRYFTGHDIDAFVGIAGIWEIAIKTNLGKLDPGMALDEVAGVLKSSRPGILPVHVEHAIHAVAPEPPTRDPFDRLLLAQCDFEGLRPVTIDRALVGHPLAFRF